MKTTEIELTAQLTKQEYDFLKDYSSSRFKKSAKTNRFMIRFVKETIDVRNPLDIRYKWTNGEHTLVIKKGALGSQKREEVTIPLKENQLEQYTHLFKLLEYKKGVAMYREIERFRNKTLEIALGTAYPYYYIEVEALNSENKTQALAAINAFFETVQIKPFSKSQYQSFLRTCDREVNNTFDLKNFPDVLLSDEYWRKILNVIKFSPST